jgi:alanine or glycine:cation symporter, AGCS family
MELLDRIVGQLDYYIWQFGVPLRGEVIPWVVMALLGTGIYLTFKLRFIQLRKLAHGFAVTSGRYDDPAEPGDVSHFQALTTALSATVGIGNIAGVAIAIHWGGPGALFWMWVTAFLGMAVKYTEVTLAQHFRRIERPDQDPRRWEGSVSGGPMYYIERGLGPGWKWMAAFFALMLGLTAFLTGNGIQANTVADAMRDTFGIAPWITGAITATIVALVIIGGISRIGRVTAVLAPVMAAIYILGALYIILTNIGAVVPTFALIFREAFSPSAGVAGTGAGAFLVTMMWGVRRGLFSNEAGQGSAPIAHAAAKTDEPVSEGVVALLEPFIDTIVICTMTGLVLVITGAWDDRVPTEIPLASADIGWVSSELGTERTLFGSAPAELEVVGGQPQFRPGETTIAWHQAPVDSLFVDPAHTQPFTGVLLPREGRAIAADGTVHTTLYGPAVRTGGPLTMLAFSRGLPGEWGHFIVVLSILLFAISTSIAWSYYGDRCANYLFGARAILPYKMVYVLMHFMGAVLPIASIWALGDVFLGVVILPNLLALILLSGLVVKLSHSYFERQPWQENYRVHRRLVEERKARRHGGMPPE